MLRITLIALLVTVATADPILTRSFRLIEGIGSCGSAGTLLDLTLKESDGTHECLKVPCEIHVGHTYLIQADFIPSASHDSMNVRASVKFEDKPEEDLVNTNLPVEVVAGEPYSFTYPWTVTGSLGLGPVTLTIEVGNDGIKELCGTATGEVLEQ